MRALNHLPRSALWGIGDQALSSVTNFAISLFAARTLQVDEFGGFSIVFVTYTVALGLHRALASDPLVIRYAGAGSVRQREGIAVASGVALLVGIVAGLLCIVVSFAFEQRLADGLRALALTLPGLLLQDLWRFAFFASRRGGFAFLNDLIWAVALSAGLAVAAVAGNVTTAGLIGVWGGAGTLAALAGAFQAGVRLRPGRALQWWREQRDLAGRFLAEFFANFGAQQLTVYGIGTVLGLSAVGALRGAQLLLGPLNVPLMASGLVGIPEGVRLLGGGSERLRRLSLTISLGLLMLVLGWGALLFLMPEAVGLSLLRANWQPARAVLLPIMLGFAGSGVSTGAVSGLRALAAARRSVRVSAVISVCTFTMMIGAGLAGGLEATAWAYAVVRWFGAGLWWQQYWAALAEHTSVDRTTVRSERSDVAPE